MKIIITAVGGCLLLVLCTSLCLASKMPDVFQECDETTISKSGTYSLLGIKSALRKGPDVRSKLVLNNEANELLQGTKEAYLDASDTVEQECIKGSWSLVQVTSPDWKRENHHGWLPTKYLNRYSSGEVAKQYNGRLPPYAIKDYTPEQYPKTFKRFGPKVKSINAYRKLAAELALDSGQCDQVQISDLSFDRSTNDVLAFYVNCKNTEQFRTDEGKIRALLLSNRKMKSQAERAWSTENARSACLDLLSNPDNVPHFLQEITGSSEFSAPITHNVVVKIDFKGKASRTGRTEPFRATCHFEPGMSGTIEVLRR